MGNTGDAIKEKLQDLMEILDATVQSVRRILYELRPHLLDLGLDAAMEYHLKEFERHSGIKTSFNEPKEDLDVNESIKTGLFRIFQESLTNIARHSEASHVYVDLVKEDKQLVLRIRDNGRGFDKQEIAKKRRLGILGMKERCEMMGGHFDIESEPGKGTTVTVTMPPIEKQISYGSDFNCR
jgi:signal transduction histidine kinase